MQNNQEVDWFVFSPGNGEQRNMEESGCEIICGVPTNLAAEG